MNRAMKVGIGVVTTGMLALGGAAAANAQTSYQNFVATMPALQQSTYLAYQQKTTANTPANLIISAIGASYTVNAKTQNASGSEGTEKKGLTSQSAAYSLSYTSAAAGSSTRLVLTNNTYAVVRVSVSGSWKSN